jgi:hypothetical protein
MTDDAVAEDSVLYANGRTKYTGFRMGGEMHGAWSWYRTDGSLMRTGAFERGQQIGVWRTFDRDGNVVKETAFGEERLRDGVESSTSITRGEGDMPDKGPGSKSSGKKPKGGAKPGDKKKK